MSQPASELTAIHVASILRYDPETGWLWWKTRSDVPNWWNGRFAGKRALHTSNSDGYHHGCINGRNHKAHRIAWAIYYGEWPSSEIDHINGDKSDNRISNLRLAQRHENMSNCAKPSTNTSGLKGVTFHKTTGKWMAQIGHNGRKKYLGIFICPTAAHMAYVSAAMKHHGDFANIGEFKDAKQ